MAHCVKTSNIPTIAMESCSLISNEISPVITMEPRPAKEQQEEMEENTTIPLIEYQTYHTKDKILKKDLILCTRVEEWYARKKTTMREVQLRKTRLQWKQFEAILKPDRLELYHVTTVILAKTKRLAHVIHLTNRYPFRRVRLSLVSAQDYIWSLEFLHYETKSLIAFHFQSSSLFQAQHWYMSIYRLLPCLLACKNPIPPVIDIFVLIERKQQQQQGTLHKPLVIRIPLDIIVKASEEDTQLNINTKDLKPVIWSLFKKKGWLSLLSTNEEHASLDQLRLCWRSVNSVKRSGEGEAAVTKPTAISSATPAIGENIEWLTDDADLIGPQLIEQKHRLELRTSQVKDSFPSSQKTIAVDGLLTHKTWNGSSLHNKKDSKAKKTTFYAILYGHHLFFLDKNYYFYYKRLRNHQIEQQEKTKNSKDHARPNIETNKKVNNWFSATTGGIYLQHKKYVHKKDNRQWQHANQSTPNLSPSSTAIDSPMANSPPDPIVLMNAKFVIDLNRIEYVQPFLQGTAASNTFEMFIKDKPRPLYYQAKDTQTMLEWVTLITSKLKIEPHLLVGHHNGFQRYQYQPEHVKDILQSGLLYVKKGYKGSYKPQYCILAKNQHGSTLMQFDTLKNKKHWWWLYFNIRHENNQQRKQLAVYTKKYQSIQLEKTYVYSGDACILDKLVVQQSCNKEPARYYKDGAITGGNTTSECVFVIWQIAKRHFIPNFREHLSLLKLGHHLGNRGTCWVFKARSRQERDEWVWALHKEFGVLKL